MIIEEVVKALGSADLSAEQMGSAMEEIMTGAASTDQIVAFLTALKTRGETVEEVAAAVNVLRNHSRRIASKHAVVLDTCGTGGDGRHTFNISTAAAFVASGAGFTVAKHGNRAVSSTSGSADVLQALDINVAMEPEDVRHCLDDIGIAFLFAQVFHPAMKYAMAARKAIGSRTIFNILGPLSNPAGATHQLVGVFDERWAGVIAGALCRLGSRHALVVHGNDGLDEFSICAPTVVFEVRDGTVARHEIAPADVGFQTATLEQIKGGSAAENALMLVDVLKGMRGPVRDIVVLNAAAAIYAADGTSRNPAEGITAAADRAREAIDSGKAFKKLELLQEYSRKS